MKRYLSLAVIFLLSFILIATFVQLNLANNFDLKIINFIQGLENNTLTAVLNVFTEMGDILFVFVVSVIICLTLLFLKQYRRLLIFATIMAGTPIMNIILKNIFVRARPEYLRLVDISGYSFPSGHAMSAMSLYSMIIFLLYPKMRSHFSKTILIIAAIMMMLIIGVSRIYLGAHFPTDIIAGYLMTLTIVMMVFTVNEKYTKRL